MSTLVVLYIIALIVGGGLLLFSVLWGGHGSSDVQADLSGGVELPAHAPADLNHGVDVSHHGGGLGLSLASWFSMQFAVYFLAMFGLIGTTMTFVSKARPGVVLTSAVLGGILVGQLVHQALRALKRTGGGRDDLTTEDFLNRPARVSVTIESSRRGEVAIPTRTGERFLAAVARRGDDRFKVGDSVVVVGFNNGVAEVISRVEYEFVSDSKAGSNP